VDQHHSIEAAAGELVAQAHAVDLDEVHGAL
jgi:hypothetical protein